MKERKNQKTLHRHITSRWKYRKTPSSGYKHGGKSLFNWNVTSGKRFRNKIQVKINRDRARKRVHGNDCFYKRKYK